MAPTFAEVSKARYIQLTTFTKDGRPKQTAVSVAPDGDRLLVHTEEDSWKVKRIRNTPRVTVAVCDMRGRPKGEAVEAVAKVLDKAEARGCPAGYHEALRATRPAFRRIPKAERVLQEKHRN
jgi:PPOX class probable F420-dependent enzyme